jgi:5'-nucleotidase
MKLSILHINKSHATLGNNFSLINEIKERNKRRMTETLVLGDGNSTFNNIRFKDNGEVLLNRFPFDAVSLGVHQFDEGSKGIVENLNKINFPILAANVNFENDKLLNPLAKEGKIVPYLLKNTASGKKIGIFALTTMDIVYHSRPSAETIFINPFDKANFTVKKLRRLGVDIIILLSQLGEEMDRILAQQILEIDIILSKPVDSSEKKVENLANTLIIQSETDNYSLIESEINIDDEGKLLFIKENNYV